MKLDYMIDMDKASRWRVVTAGADAKAHLPYVQELGDFRAHGRYFTTREGLPSYLLKYTAAGEGLLEYEGQSVRVPAGHFFWIDCRKAQSYRTSEADGEWRVVWAHFDGPGCVYAYEQFLAAGGGRADGALPPDSGVPGALLALLDLYDAPERGPEADLRAAALLASIMADCVAAAARRTESAATGAVREARDYLLMHAAEPVTLDDLAARLSMSKFHLQRLFTRQIGRSPNAYLNELRINRAKELLRATDRPVARIAEEVGFEDASWFIRRFRAHEGLTPGAYRRRWREA